MSDVKVSIIIPFNNVQAFFEKCLNSVVNQTLKDIEIICINDNSTDSSSEILKRYALNDKRIKIINLKERKGQGYSRNLGLKEAKGEYIGFVDSDDWIDETMFEKLYKRAKTEDSDISMCKTVLFDEPSQKEIFDGYYQLDSLKDFYEKTFIAIEAKDNLLNINVAIWNKIYKREFLENSEIKFPEGFIFEDLPFFFETYLNAENISIVPENLYYYRINRNGSTMQNIGEKVLDRIDMLSASYRHIKHFVGFDEIETTVLNWLIEDIFHRASVIEPKYFEQYFNKSKEFLRSIGFTSKENMKDKGVIFLDEVLFWLNQTSDNALFYIRTFRTTDKKLDKLYAELSNVYKYSDWKFSETYANTNSQLQPVKDDVYKINLTLSDIKNNFYSEMEELRTDIDKKGQGLEEFKEKITNSTSESYNALKSSTDAWAQHFNEEFTQVYDNFSIQAEYLEDNMTKLLLVQKKEITGEQKTERAALESRLNSADKELEEKMSDKLNETVQLLKSQFEEEKRILEEKFDKKLNEQRVKYERKLIKMEEDYDYFYRKLEPVIKFLKFLGINKEKRNG